MEWVVAKRKKSVACVEVLRTVVKGVDSRGMYSNLISKSADSLKGIDQQEAAETASLERDIHG